MGTMDLIDYNILTIKSSDSILKAVNQMRKFKVDVLPVLEGRKFVGLIYARDILDVDMTKSVISYTDKNCLTLEEDIEIKLIPNFPGMLLPVVTEGIYKGSITVDQTKNSMQQELKKFMLIIEHSYDGILITDGQGYITYVNTAYERMTMMSRQELIGLHMEELIKKGLLLNDSVIMKTLQLGKPYTNIQKCKFTRLDSLVTATPIKDEHDNITMVLANVRDVTELVQLKNQLEETKQISTRYQTEFKSLLLEKMKNQGEIIANSQGMQDVLDLTFYVASSDSTVLILGESGTGKEVIARLLHESSSRNEKGAFIKINCGAIPRELLEAEMFGFEHGAFTGAKKGGKPGIFELANDGTLFLDEIGELPLDMQVKLLRVLQEQEIMRIGGTKPTNVNVRIIAATNADLIKMIEKGLFRTDLYYRLNVIPIHIPPLRERIDDIIPLLGFFLNKYNKKYAYSKKFSKEVVENLLTYSFPGNVRELSNIVERLVLTCRDDIIEQNHLPHLILNEVDREPKHLKKYTGIKEESNISANRKDDEFVFSWNSDRSQNQNFFQYAEKEILKKALEKYGSVRKTGKATGVSHTTILKKMKKLGISIRDVL